MIAASLLCRLAATPGVPEDSRASLLRTVDLCLLKQRRRNQSPIDFGTKDSVGVQIHDCGGTEALPGQLIIDPLNSSEPVVFRVATTTHQIREFWKILYGRDSIDNYGMSIRSSIHYSRSYCNAFWDDNGCVFGDGDGLIFKHMTASNDFIGHEVTHGITQYTAGLTYEGEAGALNESMSDVFGVLYRQWAGSQTFTSAEWGVGIDMMGPTAHDLGWRCLRDVSRPDAAHSMTIQPTRYSECRPSDEPHINSGVPNLAFFLAATALPWPSWEHAGRIWYAALCSSLATPTMTFAEFAGLTVRSARQLYPNDPAVGDAVRTAWMKVEVAAL